MEVIMTKKNGQIKLYREHDTYFIDNDSHWIITVHFKLNKKKYYVIVPSKVHKFEVLTTDDPDVLWFVARGNRNAQPHDVFYFLPFDCNHPRKCSQGNSGVYSHNGPGKYSIDFVVPKGTEVLACRSGLVVDVKSNSNRGGPDKSYADDANHIFIQHEDNTIGQYLHLQKNGAFVKEGQYVNSGDVIGLSGNTGWTTGPHLHFECCIFGNNVIQSIPVKFYDGSVTGYVPKSGRRYSVLGTCNPKIKTFNDNGIVFNIYEHSPNLVEIRIDNTTTKNYEITLNITGKNIKSTRSNTNHVYKELLPEKTERPIVTIERKNKDQDWSWDYTYKIKEFHADQDLKQLYNKFKEIDKDDNGHLDYCEYWHWMNGNPNEALCNRKGEEFKSWHELDANNDDIVTFEEFVEFNSKKWMMI